MHLHLLPDTTRHVVYMLQLVREAHAVILASGTLAPIGSLTQQLFPHVPGMDIRHFSCNHIVPKQHLLALTLSKVRWF